MNLTAPFSSESLFFLSRLDASAEINGIQIQPIGTNPQDRVCAWRVSATISLSHCGPVQSGVTGWRRSWWSPLWSKLNPISIRRLRAGCFHR